MSPFPWPNFQEELNTLTLSPHPIPQTGICHSPSPLLPRSPRNSLLPVGHLGALLCFTSHTLRRCWLRLCLGSSSVDFCNSWSSSFTGFCVFHRHQTYWCSPDIFLLFLLLRLIPQFQGTYPTLTSSHMFAQTDYRQPCSHCARSAGQSPDLSYAQPGHM